MPLYKVHSCSGIAEVALKPFGLMEWVIFNTYLVVCHFTKYTVGQILQATHPILKLFNSLNIRKLYHSNIGFYFKLLTKQRHHWYHIIRSPWPDIANAYYKGSICCPKRQNVAFSNDAAANNGIPYSLQTELLASMLLDSSALLYLKMEPLQNATSLDEHGLIRNSVISNV